MKTAVVLLLAFVCLNCKEKETYSVLSNSEGEYWVVGATSKDSIALGSIQPVFDEENELVLFFHQTNQDYIDLLVLDLETKETDNIATFNQTDFDPTITIDPSFRKATVNQTTLNY